VPVVELEPRPLGTAPVVLIHVTAARAIALAYGTAHRGRDVARSSALAVNWTLKRAGDSGWTGIDLAPGSAVRGRKE
jgi:hypothetical protein